MNYLCKQHRFFSQAILHTCATISELPSNMSRVPWSQYCRKKDLDKEDLYCRVADPCGVDPDPKKRSDPGPDSAFKKSRIRIRPFRKNRIRIRTSRKNRIRIQSSRKNHILIRPSRNIESDSDLREKNRIRIRTSRKNHIRIRPSRKNRIESDPYPGSTLEKQPGSGSATLVICIILHRLSYLHAIGIGYVIKVIF